jgi:hypothetical protein
MDRADLITLILLLIPIFLIQLGVVIYALVDLSRREHVRGRREVWAVALVLGALAVPGGLIVSALYLTWGRNVEAQDDTN